jgi:VWFA-related protein
MKFNRSIFKGPKAGAAFCAVLLAVSLYPTLLRAQEKDEILRVDTELAAFEVTVTDNKGLPVRDLKAGDFRVFEDGVERQVDFFQPIRKQDENRPMSIVFALDVSGSMTLQEIDRLRLALQSFINRLADYNSYFAIMSFGMEVKTLQSFTNRPDKLEKTLDRLHHNLDGLSTHAYDAVDDAIRLLRKKSPKSINGKLPKRTVILVTDGFPVGDTVSPKTVIERANEAETTVYSIILPSYSRLQGNGKPLLTPLEASGLIDRTGGRSFYANEKSYEPLFKALAEEITASYALAFYPEEKNRTDGKFHEVRIVAGGSIVKQNRSGYRIKQ